MVDLSILWQDFCTVYTVSKQVNPTTKRTEFEQSTLLTDEPCKLSFETLTTTTSGHVAEKSQKVKLFLANSTPIPAGSKIVVSRGGKTFTFKASGEPGIFTRHQEVNLDLFEEWA